jgi:hypothetical protein
MVSMPAARASRGFAKAGALAAHHDLAFVRRERRPASILMSVLLPAPLWPRSPSTSPSASVQSTLSTAVDAAEMLADAANLDERGHRACLRV